MKTEIKNKLIKSLKDIYEYTGEILSLLYIREMEEDVYCMEECNTKLLTDNDIIECINIVKSEIKE